MAGEDGRGQAEGSLKSEIDARRWVEDDKDIIDTANYHSTFQQPNLINNTLWARLKQRQSAHVPRAPSPHPCIFLPDCVRTTGGVVRKFTARV